MFRENYSHEYYKEVMNQQLRVGLKSSSDLNSIGRKFAMNQVGNSDKSIQHLHCGIIYVI